MCKPGYMDTVFGDNEPGFEPSRNYPLCSVTELKRDVWDLLVFPAAGRAKTYFRVGTFLSRAKHGDSDLFNDAEVGLVTLI